MTMDYINTTTLEYPVSEAQIRAAHPNVSFPAVFAAPDGFAPVFATPVPAFSPYTQKAVLGMPASQDGVYVQEWFVEDLEPGEAAARLADARDRRWREIQQIRDRRFQLGFQCAGFWFHSDGNSKIQHLANKDTARDQMAAAFNATDPLLDPTSGGPIVWKTMGGAFVPLTLQLALDIVAANKAFEMATFARAEALRNEVNNASDPYAIDIAAGWPAVYGE